MAPVTNPKNVLTDREKEILASAWLCFSEKPKPDYKKLAALVGMTNPVSAANAWAKIQKKIIAQASDARGEGSTTPEVGTPKKTSKKRAASESVAEDGEKDDGEETPAKKMTTPREAKKSKKATVIEEEPVDEDQADSDEAEAFF